MVMSKWETAIYFLIGMAAAVALAASLVGVFLAVVVASLQS